MAVYEILKMGDSRLLRVAQPVQTFNNATFAGHIQAFANCGGTATQVLQLAATPADQSFTAVGADPTHGRRR